MDEINVNNLIERVIYVPITIENPKNGNKRRVIAKIYEEFPFFGFIASLSKDIAQSLRLESVIRDCFDQEEQILYKFPISKVKIFFHGELIEGEIVISENEDAITSVTKHFFYSLKNKHVLLKFCSDIQRPRVFICHSHADKDFVHKLAHKLNKYGIFCWIDEAEISVGDSLIEKIREGIDTSDFVIVCLSEISINSEWVKKELDVAMNQEIENRRIKVLPIVLSKCKIPGFLKGKLYANVTNPNNYETAIQLLVESIFKHWRDANGVGNGR